MADRIKLALDAMGGDHAPVCVIEGAALARERYPQVDFILYGDEEKLKPLLQHKKALAERSTIVHTITAISGEAKPSVALRTGKDSSMRLAIDSVSQGNADGVVSAGNTGALMAMAKISLKTLPGIDRPAIISFFPTTRGESVMLDLGANISCDARNLMQFALMGSIFAQAILGVQKPSVGILNVGSEELKGHEVLREAAALIKETHLPGTFYGFIEGNDLPTGTVDVIVTDGFTGNIALKTAEGMTKLYGEFLRRTFTSSLLSRLGYICARNGFKKLRARVDPRRYNGAVFLGIGGVCVKSHGGTDAIGFSNAIGIAVDMILQGANEKIREGLERTAQQLSLDKLQVGAG